VAAAGEAVEIFERVGRQLDAALASYWLASGLYQQENSAEARAVLQALLGRVRAGLRVEPGFKVRLLMALAAVEGRDGDHTAALSYLEEVRGLTDELDDRRRAVYLSSLAYSYRETGDYEGALRTGYSSLALFQGAAGRVEMALLENELALSHMKLGNLGKADEFATRAHDHFAEQGDERMLAHVIETEAQIEAARENWSGSLDKGREAVALAERTGNRKAMVSAMLSVARAQARQGDTVGAGQTYEEAARIARELGKPGLLRNVLGDWAEFMAESGDHKAAYTLTREALAT